MLSEMDWGGARRAANSGPAARSHQSPSGGIMNIPERTYSLLTLTALAVTVVVALVGLVHSLGSTELVW